MTGVSTFSKSGRKVRCCTISASPCPGPSNTSTRKPRASASGTNAHPSSAVESYPQGMSTVPRGVAPPAGANRNACSVVPSYGIRTSSAGWSIKATAAANVSTCRSYASCTRLSSRSPRRKKYACR